MLDGDPWLQRWLPLLEERAAGLPILELRCGEGRDSVTLVNAGHSLVAIELSQQAIVRAKAAVPSGTFHCQDMRAAYPVGEGGAGVVVASLSLHYFPWEETVAIVERIRRTLCANGILVCRLNSSNDHYFGAIGYPEISDGYFLVNGEAKRFFDAAVVAALFATGWRAIAQEELTIQRYAKPKSVWEVVLERVELPVETA